MIADVLHHLGAFAGSILLVLCAVIVLGRYAAARRPRRILVDQRTGKATIRNNRKRKDASLCRTGER